MRTAAPTLLAALMLCAAAGCPRPAVEPKPSQAVEPEDKKLRLSDRRFKRDVTSIDDPLATALALAPVRFFYDRSETPFVLVPDGAQLGLIAQDVREILPAVVREELDGTLRIEYEQLTPVLIGAIQEQQALLEVERARLDEALTRIQALEAAQPEPETAAE